MVESKPTFVFPRLLSLEQVMCQELTVWSPLWRRKESMGARLGRGCGSVGVVRKRAGFLWHSSRACRCFRVESRW
jgi:hypothetical protein